MTLRRLWQEMTTEEFAGLDPERTVAVLPVAAVEQHGPHLPVSVDATLNAAILDGALALLPADCPVTVLPAMPVGKSNEHLAFQGTLSLGHDTLIRLWTDIAECVYRTGLRKLVLFNSHGGQPQIMDIVARDLRVRLKMLVVLANWFQMVDVARWFPADKLSFAWQAQDLNPAGAVGDATAADAEVGRQLVEAAADKLAKLLREVVDLPLSTLRDGPLQRP
jgi:creatinine amidohydrolase